MRKVVSGIIIAALFSNIAVLAIDFHVPEVKAPNGYPVHNLDTLLNYTTIQAAIDAPETSDGHTIFVEQGTYYEHVLVNESLSLVGENRSTTIIDGTPNGTVINITADHVRITGFTMRNGASFYPTPGYGILAIQSVGNNISYNIIKNNAFGIMLYNSSHNIISGNIVSNNTDGINLYESSNNNTVSDNIVFSSNSTGIFLYFSSRNVVSGNYLSNGGGIGLSYSNNNTVSGNTAQNNTIGILFDASSSNIFSNNSMTSNTYNFGASGYSDSHFNNSVDITNTVDGKPIYYLNGDTNVILDSSTNAGVVYLISCNNITTKDLTLTKNAYGIILFNTTNSTIENITVSNNHYGVLLHRSSYNMVNGSFSSSNHHGIELSMFANNNIVSGNTFSSNKEYGITVKDYSSNNSISKNNISNNYDGIYLKYSSNNSILGNNIIANSRCGIWLWYSVYNTFSEDNIENNGYGINLQASSHNFIYHNNFSSNLNQTVTDGSENSWDNGFEGNHWSDYNGTDTNSDGIGEVPFEIDSNNNDTYPLMGMFHSFNTSRGYTLDVVSNSTISNFEYFESNSTIKMYVSNMTANQTFGFCRVRIPHSLMNETVPITVLVNGTEPHYWNYTLYDDGNNRWIYFEYEHSTLEIVIIPEFPSLILLPLFMTATLLATIVYRKRKLTIKP